MEDWQAGNPQRRQRRTRGRGNFQQQQQDTRCPHAPNAAIQDAPIPEAAAAAKLKPRIQVPIKSLNRTITFTGKASNTIHDLKKHFQRIIGLFPWEFRLTFGEWEEDQHFEGAWTLEECCIHDRDVLRAVPKHGLPVMSGHVKGKVEETSSCGEQVLVAFDTGFSSWVHADQCMYGGGPGEPPRWWI